MRTAGLRQMRDKLSTLGSAESSTPVSPVTTPSLLSGAKKASKKRVEKVRRASSDHSCVLKAAEQEEKRHKLLSPAVTSHDIKVEMIRLSEMIENQICFLNEHKSDADKNFSQLAAQTDTQQGSVR
jgi:hypothetical protein